MADTPAQDAAEPTLAEQATTLARRWIAEAAAAPVDPAAARLADVLQDEQGLPFTLGFVDGVMRPESLTAAAAQLKRIAPIVPSFLPWYLRGAVRLGGEIAPVLPMPTVPIARRVLREMVGHLIVDARPEKLGPAIARIRETTGARLNLNLLGEAVLGEAEAARRLESVGELIRRDDVDHVSVKVSAIAGRISPWAFDEMVDEVVERLLPLYLDAAEKGTCITLDMEEYRDLDLTIAVFTRVLEDPRLAGYEAGIVLQSYLPDALGALRELTAWARHRVEHGGAPIRVRLVKGANLAMERVEATMHGWSQTTYETKLDTDANYLRCLDEALQLRNTAAVRIGVAGHNLFTIAYAWRLAQERGVTEHIEFEMLLGMAQAQMQAVAREVGPVLLYVPVVHPGQFDVAVSYLVRRLEENASSENFLSAAFRLAEDEALLRREERRFLAAVDRSQDRTLRARPQRTQDRTAPVHESLRPEPPVAPIAETDLTNVVLGFSRGSDAEPFVETAVYSRRETTASDATGAAGFVNTVDSDPALPANREWARAIIERVAEGDDRAGRDTLRAARITESGQLDAVVARVRRAASGWGALPAEERAAALLRAAAALEGRRGELIQAAGVETGKVFAEADVEVSEAVDFARYYSARARELDTVQGAVFVPSQVTAVVPPWNFPLAIPAGGVLAALAAGSGVVLKPAAQARRCGAIIAEALWESGISRELLAFVDVEEAELGRELISHDGVDRVILTGSWETAELFRSWRPDLPLLAETSGKNAIIVAPSADLDQAAADIVQSAFGHAGQKCSAASLAILVGPVGRSKRFARQLTDAARSLRVGMPGDARAEVGPLIELPTGKLAWALTELEGDERWLIRPEPVVGDETGLLWTPGVRVGVQPGSRFHTEEFFGPVLGIMHAPTLERAIDLQNAVAYGLTAGLHTQSPADLELWLELVQAGNLSVNRTTTGAIVQRQPFGGWKRSSVGAGAKAGGPNHLIGLGSWRATALGPASSTLHLRGLDGRITELIESAQPALSFEEFEWLRRAALSDAIAWDREFGQVRDVSQLGVERNLFRYRPAAAVIRATADAALQELLRVVVAAIRAGAPLQISAPDGFPAEVRRALGDLGALVAVETDAEWIDRVAASVRGASSGGASTGSAGSAASAASEELSSAEAEVPAVLEVSAVRTDRVRMVGPREQVAALHTALAEATGGAPDLAVYDGEVTPAGRIELLPFVREQAISITAHRYGNPDPWSTEVI